LTLPPSNAVLVTKRFTAGEVATLITRSQQLLGRPKLAKLLARYARPGTAPTGHRLIELLLRMQAAAADPNGIIAGAAVATAPELTAILDLYDQWNASPAWPEFQKALNAPADFLHAVATLAMASQLKTRHPQTELVAAVGNAKYPDLTLVVKGQHDLAVEVKAPQALWQRTRALDSGEAIRIVRRALSDSQGQLSNARPGVLVIAAFAVSEETFRMLEHGAEAVLADLRPPRPYLLGIALQNLEVVAGADIPALASALLVQRSRLGRNRHYQGRTQLVGDWGGDWRLQ